MTMFDKLGQSAQQNQANMAPMNYQQQIAAIRSNPGQFIQQAGVDIPDNLRNDPRAMVQHLLQTNQVPAARRNLAMPMINMLMGRK